MTLDYQALFQSQASPDMRLVNLGKLSLPSGRVFCCDPFLSYEVSALETELDAGSFDVDLCIVRVPDWGVRVALARLCLSARDVVEWRKAEFDLGGAYASEFRVDAGLACFMDQEARDLFVQIVDKFHATHPNGNYYDDVLAWQFKQNADPGYLYDSGSWLLHFPLKGDPRCVAMFASGLGDGMYTAYWGLSDDGKPASLVADFAVLSTNVPPQT